MGAGTSSLESLLGSLVAKHGITGASLAFVREGAIELAVAGVKDARTAERVGTQTIFDAASLTKPLVAHAALQLVDAGTMQLDEPLARWTPPIVPDDPAASLITLRHVLTHTCGLQNLPGKEPLRIFFAPGSRFSYSSVGFMLLQRAMEAATGEPLEVTLRRLVLLPFRMQSSSLEWNDRFLLDFAVPHEGADPLVKHRPPAANASYSLQTTAADYGAFIAAVLRGDRLVPATWQQWQSAAVMVPLGEIVYVQPEARPTEPGIGWTLGWGIEPRSGTLFQWGKVPGARAFAMVDPGQQSGMVLLTNSNTGLRLMQGLADALLPGEHPAIPWLSKGVSE
ncbi:serine hydrolase domain-containing protein [Ramlibacter sp. PS3R-8]|uniref:serine hydrolase domain-containing protein n=1 Tax=Ramlibacter sp. PS3R-8 TaxID=3133437 RepID=UPI0030AF0A4E